MRLADCSPDLRARISAVVQPAPAPAFDGAAQFDDAVAAGREVAELHVPFRAWLEREGILYLYHRPDKASGIQTGHPDFTVFEKISVTGPWPHTSFIEFKSGRRQPSPKQAARIAELQAAGYKVLVTNSLKEAIAFLSDYLTQP